MNIAELRRLEAEARPRPWGLKGPNEAGDFTVGQIAQDDQEKDIEQDRKDAALIVAMRNALPELLKALEAAQELADWCEFEVGADTGLTPGLETLREYLPPHGGVDVG